MGNSHQTSLSEMSLPGVKASIEKSLLTVWYVAKDSITALKPAFRESARFCIMAGGMPKKNSEVLSH